MSNAKLLLGDLKMKKTMFICFILFATMFIFLSCSNTDNGIDPSIPPNDNAMIVDKFEIMNFSFAKIKNSWHRYPVTECIANDTIGLMCSVSNSSFAGYLRSDKQEPVIVKITSERSQDVEYIKLVDDPYIGYILVFPNPPHQFIGYLPREDMYLDMPPQFLVSNLPITFSTNSYAVNGILEISPYGDALTAEVQNNAEKHKATLVIKLK